MTNWFPRQPSEMLSLKSTQWWETHCCKYSSRQYAPFTSYLFALIKHSDAKVPSLFMAVFKRPFSMTTVPSAYNFTQLTKSNGKIDEIYAIIFLYVAHTWTVTETGVTGGVSFTGDTPMLEALTRAIVPHITVNVRYEVYCVRSTI